MFEEVSIRLLYPNSNILRVPGFDVTRFPDHWESIIIRATFTNRHIPTVQLRKLLETLKASSATAMDRATILLQWARGCPEKQPTKPIMIIARELIKCDETWHLQNVDNLKKT